jgi:heavy metal translocating P-type ATPase
MSATVSESCCDYCGLPLSGGWFWQRESPKSANLDPSSQPDHTPQYCCSGCRLAAEIAQDRGDSAPTALLTRLGFAIFLTMNVICFTMVLWSGDVYADGDPNRTQVTGLLADVFRYLSLFFSWPVAYLLAGPLARNAWQQLCRGAAATDLLLVFGVAAAFLYSTISVLRGAGHIYFEVGCIVLVFVTLGRWLETTGKQQANAALDALAKLLPNEVRRIVGTREEIVPLDEIQTGNVLRLLPGERVPTDARILSGQAAVDEQLVTGESHPSIKECGDVLYGGTLNLDGQLLIQATSAASEGTLQRLVEAVAAARLTKGHYQRLADRVAEWFLPIATLLAVGAFAYHMHYHGIEQGLLAATAVVLIACPCALGLATPLAVWTALGTAARMQILFRHGDSLERLAAVQAVLFDKTGTLSTGEAEVSDSALAIDESPETIRRITRSLVAASSHPLSRAIGEYLGPPQSADIPLPAVQTVPGRGIVGESSDGLNYFLGSVRWMQESGLIIPTELQTSLDRFAREGKAIACLGWNNKVRAVYACHESLRPEAAMAIHSLQQLNLHLEILSGDYAARAESIAKSLTISVRADLLPSDKVAAVQQAKSQFRAVAMVGDGINDAPALATADVGIAMGCGADVSREAADVCLLSSNLNHLTDAISLARRTVRVIRQNLFWAFAYNIVGIGLACTGKLNPIWAAIAMTASSVIVVTNSLRLGNGKNSARQQAAPNSITAEQVLQAPVSILGEPIT